MMTTAHGRTAHDRTEPGKLAYLLFASPLQPSQHPSSAGIRAALAAQLRASRGDLAAGRESVAQEAGDRPELYAARMRWALGCVALAYPERLSGARDAPDVGRAA